MYRSYFSEFVYSVIYDTILVGSDKSIPSSLTLFALLQSILNNSSFHRVAYYDLGHSSTVSGLFSYGNYHIQLSEKGDGNSEFSHYELIIADNSNDGNKKRMAVLTAESLESELVEMDSSGMRKDVIIDLNREGRRWEGGELNGKPFGFGYEYSENDNLVYEGFVFEEKKVCVGKEWNDDGNNNCLVYEGGYWNEER